jgi:hypothetical protein
VATQCNSKQALQSAKDVAADQDHQQLPGNAVSGFSSIEKQPFLSAKDQSAKVSHQLLQPSGLEKGPQTVYECNTSP